MGTRIELQELLEDVIGNRRVYYEAPPESFKLSYPCIIYTKNSDNLRFANDDKYFKKVLYDVTVISKDPDDELFDKVSDLKWCRFDRRFKADNLIHDVYQIYF